MRNSLLIILIFSQLSVLALSYEELKETPIFYLQQSEIDNVKKQLKSKMGIGVFTTQLAAINYTNLLEIERQKKDLDRRKKKLNCSNVDLRNEDLGDARDQGRIGWCFAYATADLITYELGEKVSARSVAQNYHHKRNADTAELFIAGGTIKKAADASMEFGLCTEKMMPSDNTSTVTANDKTHDFKEVFIELERLQEVQDDLEFDDSVKKHTRKWAFNVYNSLFGTSKEDYKVSPVCDTYYLLKEVFPNIQLSTVKKIIEKDNFDEYTDILFADLCPKEGRIQKKIPIEEKWIDKDSVDDQLDTLETLNDILDGKKGDPRIVGVAYAGAMMHTKNNTYMSATHAGTIVGRKTDPNTGECKYLVRNTWGNTYKRDFDDENGNVWVSRDELLENLGVITYVKK